jgi:hypothetical protein
MPANTELKVCNRALQLIGADTMSAFTDVTIEAQVASALYEDIARDALTDSRWRFASKQESLYSNGSTPLGRWASSFTVPSDMLSANAITINDSPIEYDLYGDDVYCDAGSSDVLILDYVFRALEANWPAYFTIAVEFKMASVFALSVARDENLATIMENRAELLMRRARSKDSQQQTTRKLNTSRFITQRRS